jgi:ABC-type phosphate transport system substrate-binding protein
MQPAAGEVLALIPRIDTGALVVGLLSGLLSGLLAAGCIAVVAGVYRRFRPARLVGYDVLSDKPIGHGSASAMRRWPYLSMPNTRRLVAASSAPGRTMWRPAITDEKGTPITVENASQVEIEIRHIGREPIRKGDFDENEPVTVRFPGRRVVDFQVAWARLFSPASGADGAAPKPGGSDSFTLPPLQMNAHESFRLEALLTDPQPNGHSGLKRPTVLVTGFISGGEFKRYSRRLQRRLAAATALVVALLAGVIVALVVSGGNPPAPRPVCGSGGLTFKGSTAFAPIVNEVAALYERFCPQARITVRGVGSGQGLADLVENGGRTPVVAMYDGQPPAGLPFGYQSRTVGVVVFAVVGNRHLPARLFTSGMTRQQIMLAFAHPQQEANVLSARHFVPVGRTTVTWTPSGTVPTVPSGTRLAFVRQVLLGGNDTAEQNAGPCPAANKSIDSVCLEDTTMDLLAYVNSKWYSIGYAEADALLYFPNVGVIPVNGVAPTRANVLSGHYKFVATEHLYTRVHRRAWPPTSSSF